MAHTANTGTTGTGKVHISPYANIVVFPSHKGGVGKTTTAFYVALVAAKLGYSVLAVDIDPQANLTKLLCKHFDWDRYKGCGSDANIGHLLGGAVAPSRTASEVTCSFDGLPIHLWPSHLDLANVALGLQQSAFDVRRGLLRSLGALRDALAEVQTDYDVIFIDTPPDTGILTVNALLAASYVAIPCIPEETSIDGARTIVTVLEQMSSDLHHNPKVIGSIATQTTKTLKHQQGMGLLAELSDNGVRVPVLGEVPYRKGVASDGQLEKSYLPIVKALLAAMAATATDTDTEK